MLRVGPVLLFGVKSGTFTVPNIFRIKSPPPLFFGLPQNEILTLLSLGRPLADSRLCDKSVHDNSGWTTLGSTDTRRTDQRPFLA